MLPYEIFFSELKYLIMTNYVRAYYNKCQEPKTVGQKTVLPSPATYHLLPKRIYRIELGLWVPYLPEGQIICIKDIHPKFEILNKFIAASCDELKLLILTLHPVTIFSQTYLCEISVKTVTSLLPGKQCLSTNQF